MSALWGTKAETLERLAPHLTTARVLPQVRFTVAEWDHHRAGVLSRLRQADWLDQPVIVRSSALREDGEVASLAGQYASVAHVQGEVAVTEAIDRVVQSYATPQAGDQVFLQPQLRNVTISGVAFSVDPVSGGSYVVVNDQRSPVTGEVTGGIACDDELYYWLRGTTSPAEPHLVALIALIEELETLLGLNALDVEFGWANEELFLFQVRPLARVRSAERSADERLLHANQIEAELQQRQTLFSQVLGHGIAWGAMPDWNPAEMIGLRPRPLAAGLYRECITDRIWAQQRRRYGYRDVTGVPLMECFGGQALIDIRASFTSFVPAACPDDLAQRLVEYALTELRSRPELHDKVEMKLLFHCWTFDLHRKLVGLPEHAGFTTEDCAMLTQALRDLTWQMIDRQTGPCADDRQRMLAFDEWLTSPSRTNDVVTPADLRTLLRRCRDEGALAFAGLARAGFVAVCLIDSLVTLGVWTEDDRESFFHSQQTVLSRMHVDRTRMTPAEFLAQYGHLRPGTYDILVPRYDEAPEQYHLTAPTESATEAPSFRMTEATSQKLRSLLSQHDFPLEVDDFLQFLCEAIQFREYGKFVYSRGISELLRRLGNYAAMLGLSREDCSFADQSLWDETVNDEAFSDRLRQAIAIGREADRATRGITLPPLLFSTEELRSFRLPRCQPNYVTRGVACGPICELSSAMTDSHSPPDLRGNVVLLPSADPGFDWIFSTGLVAFVTKFGGANSHMAIRAREWNLPAAIGVGEVRYRRLVQSRALRVDCLHQLLVALP